MHRGILSALAVAGMTLTSTVVSSQSLADTAKKEQARRKAAAPAGTPKVYTESDLPASPAETPSDSDAKVETNKGSAKPVAPKPAARGATSEELMQQEIAGYRTRAAQIQARIARTEALILQLGNHPTGGGKVCRLPEGVFRPGETAPEQVVCPYQMESRYDEAKRLLETLKGELTAVQNDARRRGLAF